MGRRRADRTARLAALLACALPALPAGADGGTVTGRVSVSPMRFQDEPVVYLAKARPPKAPATHVMDQKGMKFVPMIVAVAAGDRVEFLNHDGVDHEVYSPDGEAFNLGTFPPGDKRAHAFRQPGVYRILCHHHPEMLGYVFVGQNRHAAPVDRSGRYRLEGVPPGTYQLAVWNPHVAPVERTITVAEGGTVEESFALRP
jgi:plastocyanin